MSDGHGQSVVVRVVSKFDDFLACQAIRAAAFVGQGEPLAEEFDGNDLSCATHLLATRSGEPVGTIRIRLLSTAEGGTAVWERLAILPSARGHAGILLTLADAATAYTEFKGVRTVLGSVSDPRLLKFWQRRGFLVTNDPPMKYNGVDYKPVRLRLPVVTKRATRFRDISRREGELFESAWSVRRETRGAA